MITGILLSLMSYALIVGMFFLFKKNKVLVDKLTSKQEHIMNLINIGAISVRSNIHNNSFTLSNQDGSMTISDSGLVYGNLVTLIFGTGNYSTQTELYKALKNRFNQDVNEKTQDYLSSLYTKFIAGDKTPDPNFKINPNSLAILEQQKLQDISDYEIGKQAWQKLVIAVQQGSIKVTKRYIKREAVLHLEWPNNKFELNQEGSVWVLHSCQMNSKGIFPRILSKYFKKYSYNIFLHVVPNSEIDKLLPYVENEAEAAKELRKNIGLDDLDSL